MVTDAVPTAERYDTTVMRSVPTGERRPGCWLVCRLRRGRPPARCVRSPLNCFLRARPFSNPVAIMKTRLLWSLCGLLLTSTLQWTIVFAPLIILPLLLMSLGFSWFLASFGVFVRDVAQTIGLLVTVLMFLSPIFYPVAALPENYRVFIYMNPLTVVIEQMRDVLIWGKQPSWSGWGVMMATGCIIAWCGLIWFQKTRKGFADVL